MNRNLIENSTVRTALRIRILSSRLKTGPAEVLTLWPTRPFEAAKKRPWKNPQPFIIIRKSKCSTDFKRNDFLKKNEAYPLGALRSLKFAYRKLRISLFVELAV